MNIPETKPEPTEEQLRQFMKLMSRHKPGREQEKANIKKKQRKKLKAQKASRKLNRK